MDCWPSGWHFPECWRCLAKRPSPPASLKFKMKSIDGKPVDMKKYNGRVMLVVNLASQ
ncbi:MAG: hypothetical protein CM1200mP2_39070 [Planctomycetaceae bacterium]|nr:MAG: hypothetical protein CM1200mP2_39070 [Planctomycetaceae bacterium]